MSFRDFLLGDIVDALDRIERRLFYLHDDIRTILSKEDKIMALLQDKLDALSAQVTQTTDLETSAITLLTGLSGLLQDAKNAPDQVQAISDKLAASAALLASAITANTPAAPGP